MVFSSQQHASTTPTEGSGEHARPWRQAWAAVPDHNPRSEQDVHVPGLQQGVRGMWVEELRRLLSAQFSLMRGEGGGRGGGTEGRGDGGEGVGRWRQRFMYVTYLVLFL